ncbi:amidase [Pigmentiphaga litoralis]|uniref:amidase n=1 Tax=Pigmentiphaga litoralis TaxID=516702 RepID=UPI001679109F|nr:amidase [Pigmentiphaga litoralis]GGX06527.1 amidase [Pigmentiphaga litoralis]
MSEAGSTRPDVRPLAHAPSDPTLPSRLHPPSSPAWQLSAIELGAHFAAGTLTPVQALQAIADRMAAVNPQLNAVISHRLDDAATDAEASAARWRAGTPLSALDGVPFTVKDNIPVQGLPCTWGSRLYAAYQPDHDELAVERLRAAGMIVIGKTNVPEFTLQGYTDNLLFGPTVNPWDRSMTPGGSSGGAVACVAAGIAPVAIGTDGGGSIRRPCSHTGLVGFKPGEGTVPRERGLPEILPGMEVIGPITRTVADAAAVLRLLTGGSLPVARLASDRDAADHDVAAPAAAPAPARSCTNIEQPKVVQSGPLRIAYWPEFAGDPVDPAISASVNEVAQMLAGLNHIVDRRNAPAIVRDFNGQAWPVISQTGLAATLHATFGAAVNDAAMTPALQAMAAAGRALSATDLFNAQALVRRMKAELSACFATADLLLLPSAAALPWPAAQNHPDTIGGQAVGPRGHAVFTAFVNAAGLPAINLPARPAGSGMPIGFQLIGPTGAEQLLLDVAAAFEAAHPWADRWPVLS